MVSSITLLPYMSVTLVSRWADRAEKAMGCDEE